MAITSFNFTNQRGVRSAECAVVPPLMLIAGPNGSGKSTLLNLLRDVKKPDRPLYIGPHRFVRRGQIAYQSLMNPPVMLEEVLADKQLKPRGGQSINFQNRDPWNVDEALSFVRYSLCQIEFERKEAISAKFDRDSEILKGSVPDPWKPLRELTTHLLPHLRFAHIDVTKESAVRCLWRVHNRPDLIDLDDLSSGEKTVVQLFFPLVQRQIRELLSGIRGDDESEQNRLTVIIDEPELHLHPQLQIKAFDYFRRLVATDQMQFVLATQSATLVEYATSEELYLMRPVELVGENENQLVRVASDQDRLDALRSLYGTMSNATSMQPIIVVEGTPSARRAVPDRRLYRQLHPSFDKTVVVSGGGKGECLKLRNTLQDALGALSKSLKVVALLDRDTSTDTTDPDIYILPVSMIENFFVDPHVIWDTIQSVVDKTDFKSVDDVAKAIDTILDEQEATEAERRVVQSLGAAVFRARPPVAEIGGQLGTFVESTRQIFSDQAIDALAANAQTAVQEAIESQRRREIFDGKAILDKFFKSQLHSTGMSKEIFYFELARHASKRKSVQEFFNGLFTQLLAE